MLSGLVFVHSRGDLTQVSKGFNYVVEGLTLPLLIGSIIVSLMNEDKKASPDSSLASSLGTILSVSMAFTPIRGHRRPLGVGVGGNVRSR